MIDSHAHLFLCEGSEDGVVAAAAEAGVERMLNVGLDADSNRRAIGLGERQGAVYASVGRHPTAATGFAEEDAADIARLAQHERVRAIGETGLDFYRDEADPADQRRAFAAQIEIARDAGLPIVIHARDPRGASEAIDEIFATLDRRAAGHPVILHCFSAPQRLDDAIERGWLCSFAGNATYPTSGALREAASRIPDELVLVETDAPYLTPQPRRGQRNQPANVVATAEAVAAVRGVSYAQLEQIVEANARAVFGW